MRFIVKCSRKVSLKIRGLVGKQAVGMRYQNKEERRERKRAERKHQHEAIITNITHQAIPIAAQSKYFIL